MKIVRILVLVLAVFFNHVSSEPGWHMGPINFLRHSKPQQVSLPEKTFKICLEDQLKLALEDCSVYECA
ncbi:hypothetical protein KM043_013122 [Ampulex compressa]|nr:hypothetical protein KM043_013122 [Ampulex compressa]